MRATVAKIMKLPNCQFSLDSDCFARMMLADRWDHRSSTSHNSSGRLSNGWGATASPAEPEHHSGSTDGSRKSFSVGGNPTLAAEIPQSPDLDQAGSLPVNSGRQGSR